ncbi:hypothetical protein [Paenibacillus tepidiphilus]|uniref:hypothetical protein n=1 Tax=Paenibacillus tepidiphilus TaxID=2608683 RepID=UPI0012399BC8|nr:hypothetical protein [Paenibacillus tepidiphilus]
MKTIRKLVMTIVLICICSACAGQAEGGDETGLSLDRLRDLAGKGEALTWEDFTDYPYEDVGSGLYVRQYQVEGGYRLLINGPSTKEAPFCICLVNPEDESNIDIRYSDIDPWIDGHN